MREFHAAETLRTRGAAFPRCCPQCGESLLVKVVPANVSFVSVSRGDSNSNGEE